MNNQTPLLCFDETQITHPENRLTARGDSAALAKSARPPAIAFHMKQDPINGPIVPALAKESQGMGVAYALRNSTREGVAKTPSRDAEGRIRLRDPGFTVLEDVAPTVLTGAAHFVAPPPSWCVRRLTPVECERLQDFPDGWTLVPIGKGFAKDSPRYAALGNSMAVCVMRWIGRRIAAVDSILYPKTGKQP